MLNKLLALLLSAGLLLSPLNAAVDNPSLASGELTANVAVTVGKQQAVWEKYSVTEESQKEYYVYWFSYGNASGISGSSYWNYSVNQQNGEVYMDGMVANTNGLEEYTVYGFMTFMSTVHPAKYVKRSGQSIGSLYRGDLRTRNIKVDAKGTYLSDTTADVDTLPQDGVHTDGYWYVFKKLVED